MRVTLFAVASTELRACGTFVLLLNARYVTKPLALPYRMSSLQFLTSGPCPCLVNSSLQFPLCSLDPREVKYSFSVAK